MYVFSKILTEIISIQQYKKLDDLFNFLKNMSLDERWNVNLEETATDGYQNQSDIPKYPSVTVIYKEQLGEDG